MTISENHFNIHRVAESFFENCSWYTERVVRVMKLNITKIRRVLKVKLFLSWHSIPNIWRDTKATSPIVKYFSLAHVVYIEERRKSSAVECKKRFLFEHSSILIVKWDESELFIEIVCRENASGFDAWKVEKVSEESGMAWHWPYNMMKTAGIFTFQNVKKYDEMSREKSPHSSFYPSTTQHPF